MLESRLIPLYLTQGDRVWIEAVIDIYKQFVGRTFREVRAALAQSDFYIKNTDKLRFVDLLLQDLFLKQDPRLIKLAPLIRSALFEEGGREGAVFGSARLLSIEAVAVKLKLSDGDVEDLMFADIKSARILREPLVALDPEEIRLRANLKLVQSLLLNAENVVISMRGVSRPLIQCAKWLGLIICFKNGQVPGQFIMEISGPLSILISTRIYGQAIGRLVPYLFLAEQFTFEATICRSHSRRSLLIRQGDPVFPKEGLKKFDSKLESKFYETFLKSTDDWHLTREPEPLMAGNSIVFPDFSLRHKVRADICWLLEIIGYWTKDYLREKIKKYALVPHAKLILCINAKYAEDFEELASKVRIVWYKSTIKPKEILEIIDRSESPGLSHSAKGFEVQL